VSTIYKYTFLCRDKAQQTISENNIEMALLAVLFTAALFSSSIAKELRIEYPKVRRDESIVDDFYGTKVWIEKKVALNFEKNIISCL